MKLVQSPELSNESRSLYSSPHLGSSFLWNGHVLKHSILLHIAIYGFLKEKKSSGFHRTHCVFKTASQTEKYRFLHMLHCVVSEGAGFLGLSRANPNNNGWFSLLYKTAFSWLCTIRCCAGMEKNESQTQNEALSRLFLVVSISCCWRCAVSHTTHQSKTVTTLHHSD